MRILIGLELNNEGRAVAWALDYPGCVAYADEGPAAVVALARELITYEDWVTRRSESDWLDLGDFDLRVVDTWQVVTINDQYDFTEGGYAVNAWFWHDWKPLTGGEVASGLDLLRWSREDFLQAFSGIPEAKLDLPHPGERWTIRGIARHVANAEWWYLDRLGLAEGGREQLPQDTLERLAWVRARFNAALPALEGRELVVGKEGEFWSPRKLLRRALWHEIDHCRHILKLSSAS